MSVLKYFTRTLHWGPLIALGIIKMVTITTLQCAPVWLQSHSPFVYLLNLSLFIFCSSMTVFHFFASLALGPGYVPLTWSPEKKKHNAFLQFCKVCNGYKAPRSHHCSKCQRCVLKMDHHCPWINNCVGHTNHGHFTAFLAFAVVGCAHASVILGGYLYSALSKPWYPRHAAARFVSPWALFWIVMSLGLAIGVVIAVGILLFFQVKSILKNRTGIEDWIVEKANARRSASGDVFLYPYDLGKRENWKQVVSLFCKSVGDGITWPVRDGCNQYSLTVEQLQQKSLKRIRSVDYEVIRRYSGSWFPLWHGLRTAFCQPCSDEARIGLEAGDIVTVTRWKKYWYYGELSKRNPELYDGGNKIKGWFPKNSVKVIDFDAPSEPHSEKAKKAK